MANDNIEFDIIVNGQKAKSSINEVSTAQDNLEKNTSKNTKAMGKYIRVFGYNTIYKLGCDIAASEHFIHYPSGISLSSISIAYIWCDYIKFSGRIALGTDSMQSRYQTL